MASAARFEVFPARRGLRRRREWRWRLVAANGEIVAQSEGYVSQPNAARGARDLAGLAAVTDAVEFVDR